jgi:flagellar protein FliS
MPYPAAATRGYLDSRVFTASQPELQLMLLDGALRFARQAHQAWDDESQQVEADGSMRRTLDVVEELVRSVSGAKASEGQRLEEEYAFIFRELTAAQLGHDAARLDATLKLLEFHRETWRLACEKLRSQPAPTRHFADAADSATPPSGFSCQA